MFQATLKWKSARHARKLLRGSLKLRLLVFLIPVVSTTLFMAWLVPMTKAVESPWTKSNPTVVINPTKEVKPPPEAKSSLVDPCSLKDVVCLGEEVVITHYQAVAAQTDASPCQGAMAGINFCDPPFPIVANNCLKLGSKVSLEGKTYTVADRLNKRFGCNHYDILTKG